MKTVFISSLHLFARLILVCMLCFMSIPLSAQAPEILNPILAVFYLFVLFYFFTFTAWHEGGKDCNRVEIGALPYMPYKGFLSAVIVTFPLIILSISTNLLLSVENVFLSVLRVIEAIFIMSVYYVISTISPIVTEVIDGVEVVVASPNTVPSTVIVSVVFIIATVCSGIGYIVGYKKILIFKPIVDKILGKSQ